MNAADYDSNVGTTTWTPTDGRAEGAKRRHCNIDRSFTGSVPADGQVMPSLYLFPFLTTGGFYAAFTSLVAAFLALDLGVFPRLINSDDS